MAKETNKGTHLIVEITTTNEDIFKVEVDNIEFDKSSFQLSTAQGILDFKYEEIKDIRFGINMLDQNKGIYLRGEIK